jgi:hypothetical protein
MAGEAKCVTCDKEYYTSSPSDRFVCQGCVAALREFYIMYPEIKPK